MSPAILGKARDGVLTRAWDSVKEKWPFAWESWNQFRHYQETRAHVIMKQKLRESALPVEPIPCCSRCGFAMGVRAVDERVPVTMMLYCSNILWCPVAKAESRSVK